jgi:Glycosyltransferase family 87
MAMIWIVAVVALTVQTSLHRHDNMETYRAAWLHLRAGAALYPTDTSHRGFFIYSPAFAALVAPIVMLPLWLGILVWCALNAGILYVALGRLLPPADAFMARAIVSVEAFGSLQNLQSNALVAGLMILAFVWIERAREWRAAFAIALGALIKIFPLSAATFGFLKPARLPRLIGALIATGVVLGVLPVVFAGRSAALYGDWLTLQMVALPFRNYSVMELPKIWLGVSYPDWPIQLLATLVTLAPLARDVVREDARAHQVYLASVLLYCLLFNHAAESPSFVIGVAGMAVWYVTRRANHPAWSDAALILVMLCTVLPSSSAMPDTIYRNVFEPYHLKTVPLAIVWLAIQVELWRWRPAPLAAGPRVEPVVVAATLERAQ